VADPDSGQSNVAWASLVDEREPKIDEVKIDSPSDVDLLLYVDQDGPSSSGVSVVESPSAPKTAETSTVDLSSAPAGTTSSSSGSASGPPASGLRLVSEAIDEDLESVLMRGGNEGPDSQRSSPPLKSEGLVKLPLPSESDFAPEGGEEPRSEASDVDLGTTKPPAASDRPSGGDLIVEAVESGADLPKTSEPKGVPDDLVLNRSKVGESDSAVDLGAPGAVVDSEHDVFSGTAEPTPSMMERAGDLDLAPLESASVIRRDQVADEEEGTVYEQSNVPAALDKPEKPAVQPKQRASAVGWLAGGAIGALAGAGVCVALWLFGLVPGGDAARPAPNKSNTGANTGNVTPATLENALADVRNGNLDKALPILEGAGEEPERLAARGEARWLTYLKQQKEKNAALKADDELVKQAKADLEKANSADAFLWLGHIEENVGKPTDAATIYRSGMEKFPKEKARFQAALDRLEVNIDEWRRGGARRPTPSEALTDARQLALLLTALQADQPAKDETEPDEAGYLFWSAAKLAKDGKYADAVKLLDKARTLHDQKRFGRIRKAQNPNSDPNEEIFLKSCADLKAYWEIAQVLKDKGYQLQPKQTLAEFVGTTLDGAKASATKLTELNDQLVKDLASEKKKSAEAVETAKQETKKAQDEAAKSAKDLGDKLKASDDQTKAAEAKVKAASARLDAAGIKAADVAKGIDELAAARADADAKMTEVGKKLEEAKFVAPKPSRADILKGVDRVVGLAKATDPQGQLSAAKQDLQRAQDALAQRHSPEEMLSIWLPVVSDRTHREAADKALADADRVLKEDKATPAAKAQARAVQGLALRDQGKFDAARTALEKSLKNGAKDSAWYAAAEKALKELSDPAAFYLPRAEQLCAAARYPAALAVLNQGLQVFPKDNGRLLALRAVVRLDQIRDQHKGKVPADDRGVAEIRQDAEAAVAGGAVADGHFASGRLAEELGKLDDARQSYQHALDAKPDNRTRLALARILLKAPPPRQGADRGEPNPQWTARYAALEPSSPASAPRYALAPPPGREEADRLADEVLATAKDDPDGLVLKAQAYAVKGLWTKALTTYVEGLRPHVRGEDADALLDILEKHPALKRPDSLKTPNPDAGGARYASGLRLFNERRFADAEKEFVAAVENDSLDARYFYFLGLTRLLLDKRDAAIADFEQAANLERQHRPDKETVNGALERVQGPARQEMNRFRP
jgi:tetratricopeptide (TPR) repeat protein